MDINLRLDKSKQYRISDHLYGIFLEDIGFAVDGGLNANMVSNYSFDGVYLDNQNQSRAYDGLRYWEYDCAKIEVKKKEHCLPIVIMQKLPSGSRHL